jgi:hypothetical protein
LLSPPVNTWRSPKAKRHSPQRSVSAPPVCKTFEESGTLSTPGSPYRRSTSDWVNRNRGSGAPAASASKRGELVRPPPPLRALSYLSVLNFFFSCIKI